MREQSNILPKKRQQYEPPGLYLISLNEDAIRTSGKMSWGETWGDWTPSRDDTFVN